VGDGCTDGRLHVRAVGLSIETCAHDCTAAHLQSIEAGAEIRASYHIPEHWPRFGFLQILSGQGQLHISSQMDNSRGDLI